MHQERLDARFSYAQALWLASFYVTIRRDARCVQTQALLKTTAGIAAKRDLIAVFSQPKQRGGRWKIDPTWFVAIPALLGTAAMLWMLAAIAG